MTSICKIVIKNILAFLFFINGFMSAGKFAVTDKTFYDVSGII